MKILIFSILIQFMLFNSNCNSNTQDELCYPDRTVTETIQNVQMVCVFIGEDPFLSIQAESKRYQVCNSDKFKLEAGKSYTVNGLCFEIRPNERWAGTPFQLKSIKPQ